MLTHRALQQRCRLDLAWPPLFPGSSSCLSRCRKKLMRRTLIDHVPVLECVVENVCDHCFRAISPIVNVGDLQTAPGAAVDLPADPSAATLTVSDQETDPADMSGSLAPVVDPPDASGSLAPIIDSPDASGSLAPIVDPLDSPDSLPPVVDPLDASGLLPPVVDPLDASGSLAPVVAGSVAETAQPAAPLARATADSLH